MFYFFIGGYTTGRAELINLLRQKSRPYLFSNALPPPVVACASQVLLILSLIICVYMYCVVGEIIVYFDQFF